MVTAHSKTFESSTRPAEKPSMGFRLSSARTTTIVDRENEREF